MNETTTRFKGTRGPYGRVATAMQVEPVMGFAVHSTVDSFIPLAHVFSGTTREADEEAKANADLIAASWDLLETCEAIAGLSAGWDEDGSLGPREPYSWETVARIAMDLSRAASAKALGGAS